MKKIGQLVKFAAAETKPSSLLTISLCEYI